MSWKHLVRSGLLLDLRNVNEFIVLWSLNSIHIAPPWCLKATHGRAINMRFMCTPATVRSLVCVRACHNLPRIASATLSSAARHGSPLLRTYRVLSYGTHDPFPLTITPLLSSRLAHTSSVNPPLDRPQRRWERYTRLLLSFPTQ